MNVLIHREKASDIEMISEITKAAFEKPAISNHTEQFIIKALREANALTVTLIAEVAGKPVGHIALSSVTLSDESPDWYGLDPISVVPELQKQGSEAA